MPFFVYIKIYSSTKILIVITITDEVIFVTSLHIDIRERERQKK